MKIGLLLFIYDTTSIIFSPTDEDEEVHRKLRRKMVIVGDGACGKTCLVTRMTTKDFVDVGYVPTVFETDVIDVNTGKETVELLIFDTAGKLLLKRVHYSRGNFKRRINF